jgi:hypothetical protein
LKIVYAFLALVLLVYSFNGRRTNDDESKKRLTIYITSRVDYFLGLSGLFSGSLFYTTSLVLGLECE